MWRSAQIRAELDSSERVLDEAGLTEAPVTVVLHRYVDGIVPVAREWPADTRDDAHRPRGRCPRAGAERAARRLVDTAAHRFPDLAPSRPADLVVGTLLAGTGRPGAPAGDGPVS
jgi:hypothetical protein